MSVQRFGNSLVNTERLLTARLRDDAFELVFSGEDESIFIPKEDGEALIAAFTKQQPSPENHDG